MKEEIYLIEKCNTQLPRTQQEVDKLNSEEGKKVIERIQEEYLSWEELKNKSWAGPIPEQYWAWAKVFRSFNTTTTPIRDKDNRLFRFSSTMHVQFLHQVDLELGGNFMGIGDFTESDKRRFIRRNLIEESIASSQLEGANTSRVVAKKMLQEGRKPKTKAEQMIVNNHKTMKLIEEDYCKKDLSLDLIMEIHKKITANTIKPEHQGKLRETLDENGKPLVIKPWPHKETIAYIAPSKEFVAEQLPILIDFANGKNEKNFIHPLIKGIMLHFWIGLLHPFEDGNGRLARIIFYWYMLKKGYWAFSYLSLSERILKSSGQYAMSYIYSEQDDNDLNYFINYNINKLKLAREAFGKYIKEKIKENIQINKVIRDGFNLNERQIYLLQYLVKDEQRFTTLKEYMNVNDVVGKLTAIKDLNKLIDLELVEKKRNGRNTYYYPTEKIESIFKY